MWARWRLSTPPTAGYDPAGGQPAVGRAAIADHFARVLSAPRDVQIMTIASRGTTPRCTSAPRGEDRTCDQMIAVDLRSVFMCCRWPAPQMVERGSGRIINIASQFGIKGGERLVHYCDAKAGVIELTKAQSRELAPRGVLVNVIAPGPIETPLAGGLSEEWKQAKEAELPLRRFGHASGVTPSAVLLASGPGGNLYVGQVLGPTAAT